MINEKNKFNIEKRAFYWCLFVYKQSFSTVGKRKKDLFFFGLSELSKFTLEKKHNTFMVPPSH